MQITKAEVMPIELKLRHPVQMAGLPPIGEVTAVFVRLETRQGGIRVGLHGSGGAPDRGAAGRGGARLPRGCGAGAGFESAEH